MRAGRASSVALVTTCPRCAVDVLAARATKPIFGTPAGALVWAAAPRGAPDPLAPSLLPWQVQVLGLLISIFVLATYLICFGCLFELF